MTTDTYVVVTEDGLYQTGRPEVAEALEVMYADLTGCGYTGRTVALDVQPVPGRPYQRRVTCPACGETWTRTR